MGGGGGGGYVNIPHSHLKEQWSENTNKNKPPFWWEGAPKTLVSLLVAHFDTTVSSLLPPLLPLHLSKGHHLLLRRGSRPFLNHTTWTAISSFQSSSHANNSVVPVQISGWCWDHPGAPTTALLQSLKQSYTVQSSASRPLLSPSSVPKSFSQDNESLAPACPAHRTKPSVGPKLGQVYTRAYRSGEKHAVYFEGKQPSAATDNLHGN